MDLKWRFFENDGFSLAMKPGIIFPTGNDPAFILGGLIYSITDKFDIDCGVKYGLTSSENDLSWLAGITIRF